MTHKLFSKVALLISLSALAVVSCTKKEEAGGASDRIRVGVFASLTGETATFGQSMKKGADLAQDEYNTKGGLGGKKIDLITYDDQSKPEEASAVVTKLITQDNVIAFLGEIASRLSLVAADKAMQFKTPMLSPGSTNPDVTKKGDYVFRICFNDLFQGEADAKFAADQLKAKTVAVIRDVKQDYSMGLSDSFIKAFKAKGGTIVTDTSYQSGESDFRAQLTEVKAKNPDLIYLPGYYGDVSLIIPQARKLGLNQPVLGGDGWESPDLLKVAGKAALQNTYYSTHYAADSPDPMIQDFIKAYQAKYNEKPDAMAALGFDAFNVMMNAIKNAKAMTREAVRDSLAATKDFKAVTGVLTIDKDRNAVKPAVILKFSPEGEFRYFSTVNP